MITPPVQMIPQSLIQSQNVGNIKPSAQSQQNETAKTYYQEQSMAISYDIAAEYSAIGKINNLIANVANELKNETDPVRKKLLEARVSTLDNMVLQREARLNSMEQALAAINSYAQA